MKTIIISAINITNGGPLSILKDSLNCLNRFHSQENIIILVNNKKLFLEYENLTFIEFKHSKKSWLFRLFYEYIYFYFLSLKLKPNIWFSLHDVTPNVKCSHRFVYCHNPMPFYKLKFKDLFVNPKLFIFSHLYKFVYKINIKKNCKVIVQQNWIKEEFEKMFDIDNVLIAYPNVSKISACKVQKHEDKNIIFFYPTLPRIFKNIELICESAKKIKHKNVRFVITINGKENKYANRIYKKYCDIKNIDFIGRIDREEVYSYYQKSSGLIFPSKLETFGLPIIEFKEFNKPIFISNLPYAKETLGEFHKCVFINPNDSEMLAKKIDDFLNGKKVFNSNKVPIYQNEKFYYNDWKSLFEFIFMEGCNEN